MGHSKTEKTERSSAPIFPIRSDLKLIYINTLILVILTTGISIAGIIFRNEIYPNEELSLAFVPNDFVNLFLGVPVLICSGILSMRKMLIGALLFPGALFYISYIYLTYLLGLPFNVFFIPYMILVVLSIYTIGGFLIKIDSGRVQSILEGHVPIRTAGYIIFVLACLIVVYQVYQVINSQMRQAEVGQLEIAQWIVDLVFAAPPFLIIGILMIRRNSLGYTLGTGLLLLLSTLFIGLVPIIIVTSKLTGTPVNVTDIVIISGSSMICIIPFLLFARGINKTSKSLLWKK